MDRGRGTGDRRGGPPQRRAKAGEGGRPREEGATAEPWRATDIAERENRLNRAGGFFRSHKRAPDKRGMGGAQPLAASFAGASSLNIECQQSRIDFRLKTRYVDEQATDLDDALQRMSAGSNRLMLLPTPVRQ